jgi:Beta-lactamase
VKASDFDAVVADPWGGHADLERHGPWDPFSMVQPCSVSKPFVAVRAGPFCGSQE